MKLWHKEPTFRGSIHGSQSLYMIYKEDEYCKDDRKPICEVFREGDTEELNARMIEFAPDMIGLLEAMNKYLNNNSLNKIRSGSTFHKSISALLDDIKDIK